MTTKSPVVSVDGTPLWGPRNNLVSAARALGEDLFKPLFGHRRAPEFAGAPVGTLIWEDDDETVLLSIDYEGQGYLELHQINGTAWKIPLDGSIPVLIHEETDHG